MENGKSASGEGKWAKYFFFGHLLMGMMLFSDKYIDKLYKLPRNMH